MSSLSKPGSDCLGWILLRTQFWSTRAVAINFSLWRFTRYINIMNCLTILVTWLYNIVIFHFYVEIMCVVALVHDDLWMFLFSLLASNTCMDIHVPRSCLIFGLHEWVGNSEWHPTFPNCVWLVSLRPYMPVDILRLDLCVRFLWWL